MSDQLGQRQRRREERQQRRRVDPDQEGPAVALQPAPLGAASVEAVVVVDHRPRLQPDPSPEEPHPHREVDVLVVEEEGRREAADLAPAPQWHRQAGAGSGGHLLWLDLAGHRLAVAPRPGDAGEVDRVAEAVHPGALLAGDRRHPGIPAAALEPGQPDRRAKAGQRLGVRVEHDQEVSRGLLGGGVAGRRESLVGPQLQRPRPGCKRAGHLEAWRRGRRCRRRSARRRDPARRPAPAGCASAPRRSHGRRSRRSATARTRRHTTRAGEGNDLRRLRRLTCLCRH